MIYNPESLNLKVSSYSENEAICLCPFHHDTKPSASFNMHTGLFYCFSCGTAHNVKSLAWALGGTIEQIESYSSSKADLTDEKLWLRLLWSTMAYDNEYLAKRRVSNELIKLFNIRCNERGVIFPIVSKENKTVGVQLRQYNRKPKYLTFGEKLPVWPMFVEQLPDIHHMFVVEGVFGAINLYRLGYNARATMGAMMKKDIQNYIHAEHILGWFDNDFAGYVAGARLLKFIPRAKIIVPGIEIDEIVSNADLTKMVYNREHTRYIPQLAELSGDKEKFYSYLPKV